MNDEAVRRRDEASAIITSGHIWHAVWYLAWPTAINTIMQSAYVFINRIVLGKLGDTAAPSLAAAGIGGGPLMVQFALMIGLSVGTSALVARFLGAQTYE